MSTKAAVVGMPARHSLSPAMHNAAYKSLDLDWNYEALDIPVENAEDEMSRLFDTYQALNITMPHKHVAFKLSDETHGAAKRLEVVNTIVKTGETLNGYCTDGDGFVAACLDNNIDIVGTSVLLLGAGGAAAAITDALTQRGARVVIAARRLEAAEVLHAINPDMTVTIDYDQRGEMLEQCSMVINATPVGMTKDGISDTSTPIDTAGLTSEHVVVDTIYYPEETELLRQAREKGCATANGLPMLLHQGAIAFSLMTGVDAPIDVMREALTKEIERRKEK